MMRFPAILASTLALIAIHLLSGRCFSYWQITKKVHAGSGQVTKMGNTR